MADVVSASIVGSRGGSRDVFFAVGVGDHYADVRPGHRFAMAPRLYMVAPDDAAKHLAQRLQWRW